RRSSMSAGSNTGSPKVESTSGIPTNTCWSWSSPKPPGAGLHRLCQLFEQRAPRVLKIRVSEPQQLPPSQGDRVVAIDVVLPIFSSGVELKTFGLDDHSCLGPGEVDEPEEHVVCDHLVLADRVRETEASEHP